METIVPCVIGLLSALCTASILMPHAASSARPVSSRFDLRASLGRMRLHLADAATRLGSRVPAGLLEREPLRACAREAARLLRPAGSVGSTSVRADAGALILVCAAGSAGTAVVSGSALGALIGLVGTPAALSMRAAGRQRARARKLASAMPEAFGALAIALGSGHSLAQGMRFVGSHAEEPVRTEFLRASFSIVCGMSATSALDELLARLPAPGLDLVALALKVSQRTGAPLKDLLAEASEMVGDRIELVRRLEVKTAQARMSARMVALMPVAMTCILALLSKDFQRGLTTAPGTVSVVAALALNAAAWMIIRRIMDVRI
ncbi:Type II secretion system F domain protein [Coriobacterium glomerans PW2]|uniref:Type II secretion system F domain protein n=1 Tax=Coriobacterium glomerans (strain ATCC 49209 / DSM 20642 / JCM 10262 / PW2) TaxID=700015 RepID=F2NA65_CORGP|nr:type II secretion system F family protein [Coriobacterium glomerans]AEB06459.1 Type II secretion system F domain protein [Coriobacterium glomerans PW2]